jgi:hypothetical protein
MRDKVVTLFILGATFLVACQRASPTVYSVVSPSGNEVRLIGDLNSRPSVPFVENTISLEVPGAPNASLPSLPNYYVADWMDDSFRDAFPTDEWLSGGVLRFNWAQGKAFPRYPLIVMNASELRLSVLLIGAGDRFVILKVDPKSNLRFDVPDNVEIHVSGLFVDGSLLRRQVFSSLQGSGRSLVIARDGARLEEGTTKVTPH